MCCVQITLNFVVIGRKRKIDIYNSPTIQVLHLFVIRIPNRLRATIKEWETDEWRASKKEKKKSQPSGNPSLLSIFIHTTPELQRGDTIWNSKTTQVWNRPSYDILMARELLLLLFEHTDVVVVIITLYSSLICAIEMWATVQSEELDDAEFQIGRSGFLLKQGSWREKNVKFKWKVKNIHLPISSPLPVPPTHWTISEQFKK